MPSAFPIRVIVHACFYRTGTTSVQAFLSLNRRAIAPYAKIYMGERLGAATSLGRVYGKLPVFWRRRAFARAMDRFLTSIVPSPCIVISRESFCGMMIGYTRLGRTAARYAETAIPLAREIRRAVVARFGPDLDLTFVYTTRNPDAVTHSSYGHVLRSSRMRDTPEQFAVRFADTLDLENEAALIRHASSPTRVATIHLDSWADHPFGPAAPLRA